MSGQSQIRRPRLILIDSDILTNRDPSFEFAELVIQAAKRLRFRPALAVHSEFASEDNVKLGVPIARAFHVSDMSAWSLGCEGASKIRRDVSGKPVGGTSLQNTWERMSEKLQPPAQRPESMLGQWSNDLAKLLVAAKLRAGDHLIINGGDDFSLLAIANAFHQLDCPTVRIDVVFQSPILRSDPERDERARQFTIQVNDCIKFLEPHRVHFHATTDSLAKELRSLNLKGKVHAIPYPIRAAKVREYEDSLPIKIHLAGTRTVGQRPIEIATFLRTVEETYLRSGRCRVAMNAVDQSREAEFLATLSGNVREQYQAAANQCGSGSPIGNTKGWIEVAKGQLAQRDYSRWIHQANVAVFFQEPTRYANRCCVSLLDFLVRGIPVVVPDKTWLAEKVRAAGGHRSIGFIYQSVDEIPGLVRQFGRQRAELHARASEHAPRVAQNHSVLNTLKQMGIVDDHDLRRAA